MKKLIISENEKKDILDKYTEIDDKLMIYLRRNYFPSEYSEDQSWFGGKHYIMVDDKPYSIKNNFQQLVNGINFEIVDKFGNLSEQKRKQTIKKFLKSF